MGLTQRFQFPFPELGDSPDVPRDLYELAHRLDAILADVVDALQSRIAELELELRRPAEEEEAA
jgi:hypothetical protein